MRWNFIILRFFKSVESFLLMCWICAEILQEKRWIFFCFHVFSRALKFSTDVENLCWNFARNALKIYCFHVFSRALKFVYWFAEFALKINKNCAEILIFYVFSRALKVFYWCVEFVLKLCKKCAEILLFSRFLKSAELFLRMWWICAETLQEMRWNFIAFTFSQERWNFSTDVLNLCWNFAGNALKFFYGYGEFVLKLCNKCAEILLLSRFFKTAETSLRMCWICVEN